MSYETLPKRYLLISLAPLLLVNCMGSGTHFSQAEFAPVIASPPPERTVANGAIFQTTSGYSALTNGMRASNKGDIISILLVEQTRASKSNSATKDRSGGFSLSPPTTGLFSLFSPTDAATSGSQNFSGSGKADQSNSLQGQISVTVVESYSNGTMLVRGQKLTSLNRGDEHTQFSGLIRAIDVSSDNTVPSTKVANARIVYGGTGEIATASKQGWLQKFFSFISPF